MRLFAIGDPHLSLARPKPMDIFGDHWRDHAARISAAWRSRVTDEDLVLVVGDISWARRLPEAAPDLAFLAELPGEKVLGRGNHDHWWDSKSKVEAALPPRMRLVDRSALRIGRYVIAGSRGWEIPASGYFQPERDTPLLAREAHRLALAIEEAKPLRQVGDALVVMVHYPPVLKKDGVIEGSVLWDTIRPAAPDVVIHGHIHGPELVHAVDGPVDGIHVHCVSADHVRFAPRHIEVPASAGT